MSSSLPSFGSDQIDTTFRNSFINIENLVNVNLDVSVSSKDKLREIFSLMKSLQPKDVEAYHDLIKAIIDMNKCTKFTANRIGPFEKKVMKTTHLV